jgi:antirestriction protein
MEHDQHEHDDGRHETLHDGLRPQIYVASLADYNAGRLHGSWIDATLEPEDIEEAIQGMLTASPEPGAEEYAIHDTDEFGCIHIDEFMDIASVSRLARGLARYGCAFGHWADYVDHDPDELNRFDETYRGRWNTLADYASDLLDDLGVAEDIERGVPQWVRPYVRIDLEMLGRDLATDCYVVDDGDGVWVFEG